MSKSILRSSSRADEEASLKARILEDFEVIKQLNGTQYNGDKNKIPCRVSQPFNDPTSLNLRQFLLHPRHSAPSPDTPEYFCKPAEDLDIENEDVSPATVNEVQSNEDQIMPGMIIFDDEKGALEMPLKTLKAKLCDDTKMPGNSFDHRVEEESKSNLVNSSTTVSPCKVSSKKHPLHFSKNNRLCFESRFESGNLRMAIQRDELEYDLWLRQDMMTDRHTQWFYFCITNAKQDTKYKLNIVNCSKRESLFRSGMQPVVYSTKLAREKNIGWRRMGDKISYKATRSEIRKLQSQLDLSGVGTCARGKCYTLSFHLNFDWEINQDAERIYVAYCYPYTLSRLQRYLINLEADEIRSSRFRRRKLCETVAGNTCHLLTITSFSSCLSSNDERNANAIKNRKGVLIAARVHPGETNSSWIMEGLIDFLTGPSIEAKILRDRFVFKVIPMLNPDGVVVGNSRCSLAGVDLNRCYKHPDQKLHPTIFNLKRLVQNFQEDREVFLFTDIHGHSQKKNIFLYGNKLKGRTPKRDLLIKSLKNIPWFSESDCSFKTKEYKENTGRVCIHRESKGRIRSYTLEASFAGANFGVFENMQFSTKHYKATGKWLVESLLNI